MPQRAAGAGAGQGDRRRILGGTLPGVQTVQGVARGQVLRVQAGVCVVNATREPARAPRDPSTDPRRGDWLQKGDELREVVWTNPSTNRVGYNVRAAGHWCELRDWTRWAKGSTVVSMERP